MAKKGLKGGPRRMPTPSLDLVHLVDVLMSQVRHLGVSSAFQFGVYMHLGKTQAIDGAGLVAQESFLKALLDVNETLLFNYSDLKEGYSKVCKEFSELKESFSVDMRATLTGKLAAATMTLCTHMRRLKIGQKFQEATKNLSDWQSLACD